MSMFLTSTPFYQYAFLTLDSPLQYMRNFHGDLLALCQIKASLELYNRKLQ